jgi:hypothetical protein
MFPPEVPSVRYSGSFLTVRLSGIAVSGKAVRKAG